ncbi:MAG: polysaccharide deacetylase family protein [Clostridia bacterium]|nr:polysaccharide deacetylase family protein [Clostridia bacterium]
MLSKTKRIEKRLLCLAVIAAVLGATLIGCLWRLRSVPASVTASEESEARMPAVPILMYHSVCNNRRVQTDYRVSPELFESDLAYLQENGYTAVFVADLIAYVYEGYPLPEKPVILTLDDGYLNNLTEVLPLLEKYDMKATVSVVGEFAEDFSRTPDRNPLYAYLTWEDIRTLDASGRVEIGNHTYAMHEISVRRGCMKLQSESEEKYDKVLTEDLSKLQDALTQNAGLTPIVFTYPYGFVSEESLPVIQKLGFLAALTCYERINYITGEPEQLYRLGRFNRAPGVSTEVFMRKIGV